MRGRRYLPFHRAAALAFLVGLLPGWPADPETFRLAKITYLTSGSFYLDAGSEDGLEDGQSVEIVRDGAAVAVLRVTYLASHRAVCVKESGEAAPAVGDTVRFVPRAPEAGGPAAPDAPQKPPAKPPAPRRPSDTGLHGRVGVRYLFVRETAGTDAKFSQPALDLRLDGRQPGGAPIDLTIDVRSRRTFETSASGGTETRDLTSAYRMAATWRETGSPWRLTVGRQFAPSLAVINIFDGAEAEFRGQRWGTGAFTGTQPDPNDLGYSSDVREHGAYLEWHNGPQAKRRWSLATGLVGSYTQKEINREFSYLQGSYSGSRLSLWMSEEADLNRGWKKQAEGKSYSLTSTFLNLRFRAGEIVTLNAGYDNRRNVRLYRDRITPVTQFDDQYRTGAWGGATFRFVKRYSVGFDLRTSAGGSLGSAGGYSVYLGADRLTPAALDVRTRSTRYTNDTVEGWLHSLSLGMPIGTRWHFEVTGGVRDETIVSGLVPSTTLTWYGLDTDVALGRHWFADLSLEHSQGAADASDQAYATLAYRW